MADGSISVDQFNCPICLDLLKDSVTIPCGHSYCMCCIIDCWNQDEQRRVYSCPQCRQTFTTRPALNKNVMMAEMLEKLKMTKVQTVDPAPSYAGPGDVACDVCTGRKYKAIKSCLLCLESYCQTHFEHHEAFRTGKRHKITDASRRIQEMICPKHDKLLKVYCRTDQKSICLLCTMDEHKNHDTVSTTSERIKKKRFQSLSKHLESTDLSSTAVSSDFPYEDVSKSVSQLKITEQICKEEIQNIHGQATKIYFSAPLSTSQSEPKTRKDFQQYFQQLSLDQNTAHQRICLTEDNTVANCTDTVQQYPDHPDRFDKFNGVLCRESVSGRCYWEVELRGNERLYRVSVAVSYKIINRKVDTTARGFGYNDQSWRLLCSKSYYTFWHNNKQIKLPVSSISFRIGVYVDHRAGVLSFFSVSDTTMSLIHRVQTTFTQPLYPGFWLDEGSRVKLCHI